MFGGLGAVHGGGEGMNETDDAGPGECEEYGGGGEFEEVEFAP